MLCSAQEAVSLQLSEFQAEARTALQSLFPQLTMETTQSDWLQEFTLKAQEIASEQSQYSTQAAILQEKLAEAEEAQRVAQTECDQYRSVLGETEGMLKELQRGVEEEEEVWRTKVAQTEEQLKVAALQVKVLEQALEATNEESQRSEQLKEQSYTEEATQLKDLLSESQVQLAAAQSEAQKQREELAQVRQHLCVVRECALREDSAHTANGQPGQVQLQLGQTQGDLQNEQTLRQQLFQECEKAQRSVCDLQVQLDRLKTAPSADTELKERLEKEKRLTKDLGQAATKLQQLLRTTQDQLSKEQSTVRALQEQLQGKGNAEDLKEGTSV
ncbi:hypothetical protein COCON_G00039670 [Conger conger]|uniref:Uncharacterized protein n=1 Tax=Conger conger TaxID=82655 RepID=A0A9Q1I665_CONCO|nr:hypothetical protein COCON_G00039670 [Conger conger]